MSPRAHFLANPVSDVLEYRTPSPASSEDSPLPVTPPFLHSPLSAGSSSSLSPRSTPKQSFPAVIPPSPAGYHHLAPEPQPLIYTPSPTLSALSFSPQGLAQTPSPKVAGLHLHPTFHGSRFADAIRNNLAPQTLSEPATSPPVLRLTLRCVAYLPWSVDVAPHPSVGGCVTVGDMLERLRDVLRKRVSRQEYDAERRERRAAIQAAFTKRTQGNDAEVRNGLRRVDFLEGRSIVGLRAVQTNGDVVFELMLSRP